MSFRSGQQQHLQRKPSPPRHVAYSPEDTFDLDAPYTNHARIVQTLGPVNQKRGVVDGALSGHPVANTIVTAIDGRLSSVVIARSPRVFANLYYEFNELLDHVFSEKSKLKCALYADIHPADEKTSREGQQSKPLSAGLTGANNAPGYIASPSSTDTTSMLVQLRAITATQIRKGDTASISASGARWSMACRRRIPAACITYGFIDRCKLRAR
ncbi:hypothetical protein LshimejAT787_0800400 [Lyophyllum shimeji]|uniref:Uncharacterized protein n=1 Tax=Lyophyllum shimeji TaxID=47721 RepID=A0A9P3PRE9_LYOSH|nr:hypothetical protein LshimejAT787_0800400 [Lyophyllum shimeji]